MQRLFLDSGHLGMGPFIEFRLGISAQADISLTDANVLQRTMFDFP